MELIDLNEYSDFLNPYKQGRTKYLRECPSCGGKLSINKSDGRKFDCYGCGDRSAIRRTLMIMSGKDRQQWSQEEKDAWKAEQRRLQEEQDRQHKEDRRIYLKGLSDDKTRDAKYNHDIKKYGLNDRDRQMMVRRGMTPGQFEGWAYSVGSECYLPVFSLDGLMVGHQRYTYNSDFKYLWGRAGAHHRKSTGEQPLTYHGNRKNPRELHYFEGLAFKVKIYSDRHPEVLCVGASGNQFVTSKTELAELLDRYPKAKLVYHSDAGACKNAAIERNTIKLYEFCKQHDGREMEYDWYGQYEKSDGDIDEIPASTKIKRISHKEFLQESVDRRGFLKLGGLSVERETIHSQWVPDIALPPSGTILLVSSNVGTGKTTWQERKIAEFRAMPNRGRLFNIGARNVLLNQQSANWGIPSYRVGHGQDDAMLNNAPEVSICFDSIHRIDIDSITPNSLIICDEIEQFLSHAIEGGTTGSETVKCQEHLFRFTERVLSTGGQFIGCEDDITDLSYDVFNKYFQGRFPIKVVENTYQRFDYQVNIGRGTQSEQLACVMAHIQAGKNIMIVSTGQIQLEILERYLLSKMPELAAFIERVDGKTTGTLSTDLMEKPGEYCVDKKVRLLMVTTTAESGFSVNDPTGWIDRVIAWFPSLDIRTHYQMLNRLRSNAPRDICISAKTIQGSQYVSTNPDVITKYHLDTAKRATLQAGKSWKQPTHSETVINGASANLSARKALSSRHAKGYLKTHLQSRGHACTDIEMGDLYLDICRDYGLEPIDLEDLAESIADIKKTIDSEAVDAIHDAVVPKSMTREIAVMVQKSSSTSPKEKTVAKKCLIQLDLPGADLQNKEFLLEAIVKNRGKYRNQCQFTYLLNNPVLCDLIDNKKTEHQLQQPHRLWRQAAKYKQIADIFAPVIDSALEIAKGNIEYKDTDPEIIRVSNYLVSRRYDIHRLTGLMMLPFDPNNKQTSPIATFNKLLKIMGFKSESQGQQKEGNRRVYRYRVVNGNCAHRQTIYEALERRYREEFGDVHKDSNSKDTVLESLCIEDRLAVHNDLCQSIEDIVEGLRWIIDHPEDYESIRSTISRIELVKASKLLTESELIALRSIENSRSNRAA